MRPSFARQNAPLLVGVVREERIRAAMGAVRNCMVNGAGAVDLHLSMLPEESLTTEALAPLFAMTSKPILAVHYNQSHSGEFLGESDTLRVRKLLTAVDAGAAGIDLQGYTFEPDRDTKATLAPQFLRPGMSFANAMPNEVTLRPETIDRQRELIDEVHRRGAEVLLSTHTGCFLDCGQVLELTDFLRERKPDVIKLVTSGCDTDEQLAEYFRTALALRNRYTDTRVQYHCNGRQGRLTRIMGPMLGMYSAFCVERYDEASTFDQLPLRQMAELYEVLERC